MEQAKKEEVLKAMRDALRKGRNTRNNDLAKTAHALDDELAFLRYAGMQTSPELDNIMHTASNRKMLEPVRMEDRYGREHEIMAPKERERYSKRPSTRAIRRARKNQGPEVG